MSSNPAPRAEGGPQDKKKPVNFVDLRAEIDNQKDRYEAWRRRNADANPSCHTLPTLDRYVEIYAALDLLIARVSGDAFIRDRLREIADAERASND
jgi:hypothetical protein